jgi:hypothetical protein
VFDYIERFYNPKRRHSYDRLYEPDGVRTAGGISLGGCQRNRVQATPVFQILGISFSTLQDFSFIPTTFCNLPEQALTTPPWYVHTVPGRISTRPQSRAREDQPKASQPCPFFKAQGGRPLWFSFESGRQIRGALSRMTATVERCG